MTAKGWADIFDFLEVRADSWNAAAQSIVQKLEQAGVKRGQILSIDAHNNGPDERAIFSAHFSRQLPDFGELDIEYTAQNTSEAWAVMYDAAAKDLNTTCDDVISITSSCNAGGRGVTYVFKYRNLRRCRQCGHKLCCREAAFCCRCGEKWDGPPVLRDVSWLEARGVSWSDAAEGIVQKLVDAGAERGQILGIDAHLDAPLREPVFSAFIDRAAPGRGPVDLVYFAQLDKDYGWHSFYALQHAQAAIHSSVVGDVISMTSSISPTGNSAAFVFMDWRMRPPLGPDLELEHLEVRADSWDAAAEAIIAKLKAAGVKRGQLVSIDSHNNGPHTDAIFSAHFSRKREDAGALDIAFEGQNTTNYSWADAYEHAAEGLRGTPADVISITSSCNSSGRRVTYVFWYRPAPENAPLRSIEWVQASGGSWSEAADSIVEKIVQRGVQKGQLIGIDTHNDGFDCEPNFSAFLDLHAPGHGPLDLTYSSQVEATYSWKTHYLVAETQAASMCSSPDDVISVTCSICADNSSVAFVFAHLSVPRTVLTVHATDESNVTCTRLDGSTAATVRLEAGGTVGALRTAVAAELGQPVRLVLPDGQLLTEWQDRCLFGELVSQKGGGGAL